MVAHQSFNSFVSLTIVLVLALVGVRPAQAAPPSNDDFASATIITEPLPFADTIDSREATTATGDPDCYGNGPTVWYRFTPSQDMEIIANTFGSDYDTTLSVYTGSPGNFNQIACNNDFEIVGLQSVVLFEAVANQTYYFMVGASESGSGGTLVFSVDQFQPLALDLQISPTGSFDKEGNAYIQGTLTCSHAAYDIEMSVFVERKMGKKVIGGWNEADSGYCNGESSWQVAVSPDSGLFRGGFVSVTVEIFAFDEIGPGASAEASAVVHLKKK